MLSNIKKRLRNTGIGLLSFVMVATGTAGVVKKAYSETPSNAGVTLGWTPNTEADMYGYLIYKRKGAGPWQPKFVDHATCSTTSCNTMYEGLEPGYTYFFKAVAMDASYNKSGDSDIVSYTNSGLDEEINPPVWLPMDLGSSGSSGFTMQVEYDDESNVTGYVYNNGQFVGEVQGDDGYLDFDMALRQIQEGQNNLEMILQDEWGNTSQVDKSIMVEKGYTIIEDGEYASDGEIPWVQSESQAGPVSLEEIIFEEGANALRFGYAEMGYIGHANWELTHLDDFNYKDEFRVSVYNPRQDNEVAYKFKFKTDKTNFWKTDYIDLFHGWNEIVMPKDVFIPFGEPNWSFINEIEFVISNRVPGTVIPEDGDNYVVLDKFVSFKSIPIFDFNDYGNISGSDAKIIDDAEGYATYNDILWNPKNQDSFAPDLETNIVLQGMQSIAFPYSELEYYGHSNWDIPVSLDISQNPQINVNLYNPRNDGELTYKFKFFSQSGDFWKTDYIDLFHGWNNITIPKSNLIEVGTDLDWSTVSGVEFVLANRNHGTLLYEEGNNYVIMDNLIAAPDSNSANNAVQQNWTATLGAYPAEYIPGDLTPTGSSYLMMPGDLSSDVKANWFNDGLSKDLSNVQSYRLQLESLNPEEALLAGLYFKNDTTLFGREAIIIPGYNDLIFNRDEFSPQSNPSEWQDINKIKYNTLRLNNSPPNADVFLRGIGINDLFYWYSLD